MDSAGKISSKMDPAHGPPLQARVAAANGTVLQLANCCNNDPGAHGNEQGQSKMKLNGAKQLNGGKNVDEGSGHGRQRVTAGTQPAEQALQATQPADSPPGTGLTTNKRPPVGRPRSKNNSCR